MNNLLMPNGGSDCCGTCWFNEANKGEAGYTAIKESPMIAMQNSFCTIRREKIINPMYTYCVNHPHYNLNKIDIPIGPITTGEPRKIWKPSPDTEEIRLFLLEFLSSIQEGKAKDEYPYGTSMNDAVIIHLRDLNEERAIPELKRITNFQEVDFSTSQDNPFSRNKNATIGLAFGTLTKILMNEMIPFLKGKLKSKQTTIRGNAVLSLDYCSGEEVIELLKKAKNDKEPRISRLAEQILEKKEKN